MPEKILKILIDHWIHVDEGILKKYQTLIFGKKWAWSCETPQGGQNLFLLFFSIFLGRMLLDARGIFEKI